MKHNADHKLDSRGVMRHNSTNRLAEACFSILISFACSTAPVSAQPVATFNGLGLFGGTESIAHDVSADGSVVAGVNNQGAFRWTAADSVLRPSTNAVAVSGDGSVIVGAFDSSNGIEAFRWVLSGISEGVGDLPGGSFRSQAFDVNGDGSVIVGYGTTAIDDEAFRWTQATGMVGLGGLPGAEVKSGATGVSADGAVVVGIATDANSVEQAFRWTAETGMVGLGRMPGAVASYARIISANGLLVAGDNQFFVGGLSRFRSEAFYWTHADGMVSLGDLPGGIVNSFVHDVSADGSIIVGTGATDGGDGEPTAAAFYWTAQTGMLNLRDVLVAGGANLEGWHLNEARAVSHDGLTIVGTGSHNGRLEAWIATIPEPSTFVMAGFAAVLLCWLCFRRRLEYSRARQ